MIAMNAGQGKHDDTVSENTLLDHYDHVQIDQETIEAEIQGKERFDQRPVPVCYRQFVKWITRESLQPDSRSNQMTLEPTQFPQFSPSDLFQV